MVGKVNDKQKLKKEKKIIIKFLQKKLKQLEGHYDIVLSSVEMRLTRTFDSVDFKEDLESLGKIKYLYQILSSWVGHLKEDKK